MVWQIKMVHFFSCREGLWYVSFFNIAGGLIRPDYTLWFWDAAPVCQLGVDFILELLLGQSNYFKKEGGEKWVIRVLQKILF